ncbi:hypothetical protein R1flu_010026 [Riccia fluitans]|uniref:Uncharacterized protein n=1 Tax=Riccia fluitans TaxID=41844 RepID=A0ABD1Z6D2_9MARC
MESTPRDNSKVAFMVQKKLGLAPLTAPNQKSGAKLKKDVSVLVGGAPFEDTHVFKPFFLQSASRDLPAIRAKNIPLTPISTNSGNHKVAMIYLRFLASDLLPLMMQLERMSLDPQVEKPRYLVATLDRELTRVQEDQRVPHVSAEH